MQRALSLLLVLCSAFLCVSPSFAQEVSKAPGTPDKARVFITDSQSWEMTGAAGGSSAGFGSVVHGGARPQTAEIIKTFGERCSDVMVNNIQEKTDYIVLLDHEGGKGYLRHRNKVAVFARISGDSVVSKSTLSLGGSVQEACEAISRDWFLHGSAMRASATAAAASKAQTLQPLSATTAPATAVLATGKLSVVSDPSDADIEIDGSFVGNTPSDVQVEDGDHTITVKKVGFKDWERKMKVSSGSNVHLSAELEKLAAQ
jgi:PEGA domain